MYHEERKITIFSEHTDLEPLIRSVMEEGPVTNNVNTSTSMQTGWQDSDIIICDIPVEKLASIKEERKEGSCLFYIYSPADALRLSTLLTWAGVRFVT